MATIVKILPTLPREPFLNSYGEVSTGWMLYLEQLQMMLGDFAGLDWRLVDKTGSSLSELSIRPHSDLQNVYGASTPNIATLAASGAEVLHVSLEQTQRWDTLRGSSSNAEVLHWFF